MKSKSLDHKQNATEKVKQNRTFDFTSYYKSAAETRTAIEKSKGPVENINRDNKVLSKTINVTPSRSERTPNRKKNKMDSLDVSRIDIEGSSLNTSVAKNTPLNESKLTSTPQASSKDEPKVKSIMKNKSDKSSDDYLDNSTYASSKPKKRNKSVSFMLDDTEEVVVKKTKSNESTEKKLESKKSSKEIIKVKKVKKEKSEILGKENKGNDNVNAELAASRKPRKSRKVNTKDEEVNPMDKATVDSSVTSREEKNNNKKAKVKKLKKQSSGETVDVTNETNQNEEDQTENKNRKAKKNKLVSKARQNGTVEAEGEPAAKAQKKDEKPEAIVEDLESLSIGDNAHTLTNLLDEMTVVDKDKKKKNKQKSKKETKVSPTASNSETPDLENIEEGKEKVKWKKRKWNKDKKGDMEEDASATSLLVDNLPLSMVCDYKKHLTDQFTKYGPIKKIGVAELYPEEESKPVFTTTIQFQTEAAAIEALAEDNYEVQGQVIRVRRPLPAAQTTLVVRSYGELTDQSVTTAFGAAGRIRSIRHLVKGKKAVGTAFVEFDGPDALQRALAACAAARIGGKRAHAAPYDPRRARARAAPSAPTAPPAHHTPPDNEDAQQ